MNAPLRLRVLPQLIPVNGRDVEMRATDTFIQWRLKGDVAWIDLVSIASITGPVGPNVELQATDTYIQWRVEGGDWIDLISILAITGPRGFQGDPGEKGDKGDPGDPGSDGADGLGVPVPSPGDAGKVAVVNDDEDGYELVDFPTNGVTEQTVQLYWMGSNLQMAELAPGPLLIGMGTGNGVFDGFSALTYVDVAGATNLDTATAGEIGPTAPTTNESSSTPPSGAGTTDLSTLTIFDRSWSVDNSKTVSKIGVYSATARTYSVKIVQRTAANVYAVTGSESFAHPGGGWADKTLASPLTIPASGTYYAALYYASGVIEYNSSTSRGFNGSGDMSGTGNAATENSGSTPLLRVTYAGVPQALTVRSQAINLDAVPDWGRIMAFVMENTAGVNSDLVFSLSRDGAAYATLTMTELFTRADGSICVESGLVDLTALASGSAARWRATTANSKNPRILAIAAVFGVNS